MSSNRPCSKNNSQKLPLCQFPCLSLLQSHTASINQVRALSRGSNILYLSHWTGDKMGRNQTWKKEVEEVKCGETYSCSLHERLYTFSSPLYPPPAYFSSSYVFIPFFPLPNSTANPSLNTINFEKECQASSSLIPSLASYRLLHCPKFFHFLPTVSF